MERLDEEVIIIEEEIVLEEVKAPKASKKEVKGPSIKGTFEAAIAITPYMLFQNGIQICRWKPNVSIECKENSFVLHNIEYTYSGIEVKHL